MKCSVFFLLFALSINLFGQFGATEIINHSNSLGPVGRMMCFDYDADGDNDLFAASIDGKLLVFFENITGDSLASQVIITKYSLPAMDTADIDGDGMVDLIAHAEDGIGWYKNYGNNTFDEFNLIVETYGCGYGCDFDFDGDTDIVIAYTLENKLSWFENDGNGNFINENIVSTQGDEPLYLQLVDFDNDTYYDILASSLNGDTDVYMNNGSTSFDHYELTTYSVYENIFRFPRAVDVTGDGYLDVLNVNYSAIAFENLNGEGFGDPEFFGYYDFGTDMVIFDDISGDGNWDFASGLNYSASYTGVCINISDIPEQCFLHEMEYVYSSSLLFADLNNDGNMDCLEGQTSGGINWYRNLGDFSFAEPVVIKRDCYGPKSIIKKDCNDDDAIDFFVVNGEFSGKWISYYLNNGNGQFGEENVFCASLFDYIGFPINGIEDLNNDDDLDFVYWLEDTIRIMLNNGNDFNHLDMYYPSVRLVKLYDFNQDGDFDLIATNYTTLSYALNDGSGNFSEFNNIINVENYLFDYTFTDIDNDNDDDLIAYASNEYIIYCYLNDGAGNFNENFLIADLNSNIIPSGTNIVDINNDGNSDIVLASGFYLHLYLNNGDNTFEDIVLVDNYYNEEVIKMARVEDLDLDGDFDIVYQEVNRVFWLENLGYEFSTTPQLVIDGYNDILRDEEFRTLLLEDLDNDGYSDIITSFSNSHQVLWQKNYFNSLKISGDVYFDENENGEREEEEPGFLHSQISLTPYSLASYTNQMGSYWYAVEEGSYIVECDQPDFWGLSTPYDNYNIDIEDLESVPDTCDFGFYPEIIIDSINVDIVEGFSLCGSYYTQWIDIMNMGTTKPSFVVEYILDPAYNILYCEVPCDSIQNNNYYWSVDSLGYFENINFPVFLSSPPIEMIGDTLINQINLYVLNEEDIIIDVFSDTLISVFTCAYDPNDKIVKPDDGSGNNFINPGQELEFTIRFQNTGNDTAYNVYIKDYIDVDLVENSFELMSSSHDVYLIRDGDKIIFKFDNIMLPDSGTNLLLSQGYVKYRINAKPDLDPLTTINNKAYIYFDYNEDVQTNTTLSTVSCWIVPDIPTIQQSGNTLSFISEGYNYLQWFLNGEPISGATNPDYTPSCSGEYYVEVFNEYGCSVISDGYYFTFSNLKEDYIDDFVYPNPFNNKLYVNTSSNRESKLISIINSQGIEICKIVSRKSYIDLSEIAVGLKKGIYLLKIQENNYTKTLKIIKQ